jgi:hypothetical protein
MDIERCVVLEAYTGFAFTTRFHIVAQVLAVDGFGKNPCTGGFSNATRTAEKKGLREVISTDCVF